MNIYIKPIYLRRHFLLLRNLNMEKVSRGDTRINAIIKKPIVFTPLTIRGVYVLKSKSGVFARLAAE